MFRVPDAVQRFFSGAPQSRDRTKHRLRYDPGSAAHHFVLRSIRGTALNEISYFTTPISRKYFITPG